VVDRTLQARLDPVAGQLDRVVAAEAPALDAHAAEVESRVVLIVVEDGLVQGERVRGGDPIDELAGAPEIEGRRGIAGGVELASLEAALLRAVAAAGVEHEAWRGTARRRQVELDRHVVVVDSEHLLDEGRLEESVDLVLDGGEARPGDSLVVAVVLGEIAESVHLLGFEVASRARSGLPWASFLSAFSSSFWPRAFHSWPQLPGPSMS
jgi:hypothetical protein